MRSFVWDSPVSGSSRCVPVTVIDRIVPEPVGGAHRDPQQAIRNLADTIDDELGKLAGQDVARLQETRADRYLAIGG